MLLSGGEAAERWQARAWAGTCGCDMAGIRYDTRFGLVERACKELRDMLAPRRGFVACTVK